MCIIHRVEDTTNKIIKGFCCYSHSLRQNFTLAYLPPKSLKEKDTKVQMLSSIILKGLGLGVASVGVTVSGALLYARQVEKCTLDDLRKQNKQYLLELGSSSYLLDSYKIGVKLPDNIAGDKSSLLTTYIQCFFTCFPFQLERQILRLLPGLPGVTDASILESDFSKPGEDSVSAFVLSKRNEEEAIFDWSPEGRTWFGIHLSEEEKNVLELQFGSAILDTIKYKSLLDVALPFHMIYSQVLLQASSERFANKIQGK